MTLVRIVLAVVVTALPQSSADGSAGDVQKRARAAVAKADVQSKLEFGNLNEPDWLPQSSGRSMPGANIAVGAGTGSMLLYVGIAVGAFLLLLTAYRLVLNRQERVLEGEGGLQAAVGSNGPARSAEAWLQEADQLAGEGRWTEAVHALLHAAIRILSEEFGPPRASRTSRELIEQFHLDEPRRHAFRALVSTVEAAFFGGRDLEADGYRACREYALSLGRPAA